MLKPFVALALLCQFAALGYCDQYTPQSGDRIGLIGNSLGERLQHYNTFEAMLHRVAGDQTVAVRNLCFPGDEVYHRIRSENFGTPDEHLTHSKINVVAMFFGFNESFDGAESAAKFQRRLNQLVNESLAADYGGGPVRVILVSPIAFEDTGDANLPDGKTHNQRLEAYTAAIAATAKETGVVFADVFHPTLKMFAETKEQLTFNGSHLNDAGYRALAPILLTAITGEPAPKISQPLLEAVEDKNFHWWHRYRAVNGYSIYGTRGEAGSDGTYNNRDVMERERAILDQMTANRDERIWQIVAGTAPRPTDR